MITKYIIGGIAGLIVLVGAGMVFYPEKTGEAKQRVEAAGAVAVDKVISALEERVGKTDVAYEHYKTAHAVKRESLVRLKALRADCERGIRECQTQVEQLRAEGKDATAAESRMRVYEERLASVTQSVEKAEVDYVSYTKTLQQKKLELDELKAKLAGLHAELSSMNGGDAAYALQRARQLEEEVKSACSRMEAEMEVQKLDNELN